MPDKQNPPKLFDATMLPNKSSSNNIMLDPAGQSMSGGPQPLLSTPIQPPNSNSFNKTQRRPKMDNQSSNPKSSSHHHKGSSGSHQSHHHPSHLQQSESKFYTMASIELKDSLEITLEDSYNKLKYLISPSDQQQKPDSMSFNELSNYSNRKSKSFIYSLSFFMLSKLIISLKSQSNTMMKYATPYSSQF